MTIGSRIAWMLILVGFVALPSIWAQPEPPATQPADKALDPTPESIDDDDREPTPRSIEGPYFKRNSPLRSSLLEDGVEGTKLIIVGRVLDPSGKPVGRALLDFWQADANGDYDNSGFKLRGHQFTDESGNYRLETIVPGNYENRTRHIHVKVQAANGPVLTTQLMFNDDPRNRMDRIFNPKLVMKVEDVDDGSKQATFDFVVRTG